MGEDRASTGCRHGRSGVGHAVRHAGALRQGCGDAAAAHAGGRSLSGHFASLLRNTVRTLLPDNDVYVTDWHNARDVCLGEGTFGFDDYTELVIRFMETIGPGAHMLAVCQPCVSALVATAVMAEEGNGRCPGASR